MVWSAGAVPPLMASMKMRPLLPVVPRVPLPVKLTVAPPLTAGVVATALRARLPISISPPLPVVPPLMALTLDCPWLSVTGVAVAPKTSRICEATLRPVYWRRPPLSKMGVVLAMRSWLFVLARTPTLLEMPF